MTPGFNRHRKSTIESQKIEFLFSLVAEKLWALESINRGMDTTDVIKFTTKLLQKCLFVMLFSKKKYRKKVLVQIRNVGWA